MTQFESASENLQVIRSLMERATIYRAISAPMALIGGLLSLAGFGIAWFAQDVAGDPLSSALFLTVWLIILALTGGANIFFLWRESRQGGSAFFSPGLRLALKSLSPAFILAGVLTLLGAPPAALALVWITCYGLALLSTQHFAPRSLIILGLAFFITGCGLFLSLFFEPVSSADFFELPPLAASGFMAATFGLYHLIYAASLWASAHRSGEAHV